jgi:hypothetical protein
MVKRKMEIKEFAEKHLALKDVHVLEVYQGYLLAGKYEKSYRCFWINKQNIVGLTEVAKILAIETAFQGLLSLIPGGSFAYRLIKDQIGYPPRHNIIFEPEMYEIKYNLIMLDKEGKSENIIDSLAHNVDQIAKMAVKTGEKLQSAFLEIIKKNKQPESKSDNQSEEQILGFTYIRFYDKTSIVRNKIIKNRIQKSNSRTDKYSKSIVAELAPAIIVGFKTTENENASNFLKYLSSIGFNTNFTEELEDKNVD